jgi:DNA-binding MarR family transcriptional regulator
MTRNHGPSTPPPEPSRKLADSDYRAIGDFRRALREFLAFSDGAARQNGITSQQHQALLAIRSHEGAEPITIGQLADCLLIRNHSAVGLVARLVERGLVAREESKEDRRRVLLRLQPAGEQVLERISLLNIGAYGRTAEFLTEVLRRVQALRPGGAEPPPAKTSRRRFPSPRRRS